ncbi:MAG: hypothetical protein QF879_22545, partial [Candidatus Latescibacteria bacterium]|nr:hypothetical protein [Candidatus Latescibacterota bacterium]
ARLVAEPGGANHGVGVGHPHQGTQGEGALVLHASLGGGASVGCGYDLLTADGAGGAVSVLHQVVLVEALAADLLCTVEGGLAEVVGGQGAQAVEHRDVGDGAQCAVLLGGRAEAAPGQVGADVFQCLGVVHRDRGRASYRDGFQVLGAHDRTRTCAARQSAAVVADSREPDEFLAGGADAGHAGLPSETLLDGLLGIRGCEPYQVGAVQELDPAVDDAEQGRVRAFTG